MSGSEMDGWRGFGLPEEEEDVDESGVGCIIAVKREAVVVFPFRPFVSAFLSLEAAFELALRLDHMMKYGSTGKIAFPAILSRNGFDEEVQLCLSCC